MTHQKQSSILLLPFVGENTVDCSQFFAVGNVGQTAKDSQHFTPGVRITHLVEGLVEVGDSPLFVVYLDERTLATKHGKMLSEASKGSGRPKKSGGPAGESQPYMVRTTTSRGSRVEKSRKLNTRRTSIHTHELLGRITTVGNFP